MKSNVQNIQSFFNPETILSNVDITDFFRKFEPNLSPTTINWRIYSMVKSGILYRVGRGKFLVGTKSRFNPLIPDRVHELNSLLKKEFPYLNFCVWDTSLLNEFMVHQPGLFYTVVEVEKNATESVFYFLKDQKYDVFISPSNEILERYVHFDQNNVIVKSLVTEAPTQLVEDVTTVTLEKVLVDIFCETTLFSSQQGLEMRTIFQEAFRKYSINVDKMFRYADRRGNKKKFKDFWDTVLTK